LICNIQSCECVHHHAIHSISFSSRSLIAPPLWDENLDPFQPLKLVMFLTLYYQSFSTKECRILLSIETSSFPTFLVSKLCQFRLSEEGFNRIQGVMCRVTYDTAHKDREHSEIILTNIHVRILSDEMLATRSQTKRHHHDDAAVTDSRAPVRHIQCMHSHFTCAFHVCHKK